MRLSQRLEPAVPGDTTASQSRDSSTPDPLPAAKEAKLAAAKRRYLRSEAAFITDNALSVQKAGEAVTSCDFVKVMREFERDLASDVEARNLTDLYRYAMDDQAKGVGQIIELACGLSVCIGAIRTSDSKGYQAWSAKFDADKRTPSYSYGEYALDLGRAGLETRFFFSVDPSVIGAVAPARPFVPPKI